MTDGVKVIGLCGRSGCGKGFVGKIFEEHLIPVIDTDEVYRYVIKRVDGKRSPCLLEIISEFGELVLNGNGELDRRALSQVVFAPGNGDKLRALNSITHKYILAETLSRIKGYAKEGYRSVIVDAPVLFESGFDRICDLVFCVTAPDGVAVERICLRDGRSCEEARRRLANQKSEGELLLLCDDAVVNDGKSDVRGEVLKLIEKYDLGGKNEI